MNRLAYAPPRPMGQPAEAVPDVVEARLTATRTMLIIFLEFI
jgi:hypothetical protein